MKFLKTAEYFKGKRIEAGLSQIELSRILGYTTSQFISNWERGLSQPPASVVARLCVLLKISKREIIDLMTDEYRRKLTETVEKNRKRLRG